MASSLNVGQYLANRLVSGGVDHFFTVPGDFTLALLDELQSETHLKLVGCCNELNAGYAADGYCRETGGIGCVVVTYMVGSMSTLNAVAGAYSDDLPLLVIAGAPNTLDEQCRHTIHHTIGEAELNQSARCFEPVVAKVLCIRNIKDVQAKIDEALHICGALRKPVYLEISCNLSLSAVSHPVPLSPAYFLPYFRSDEASLQAALNTIQSLVENSPKVVLLAGAKLRAACAIDEFISFANALGCGVAVMPDAKGLFSETCDQYMGCYWVGVSSRHVQEIVESADLIITAGAVLNDYTTVGWTSLLPANKTVTLEVAHSAVAGQHFPRTCLKHVLAGLTAQVPPRPESLQAFRRYVPRTEEPASDITAAKEEAPEAPLCLRFLVSQLQRAVTSNVTSVVAEVGDSWFIGQKLKLPDGVKYHVQMQYGSCGWALGACLGIGIAQFAQSEKTDASHAAEVASQSQSAHTGRVLALIGDGSFQFSAQELTTLIRQKVNVTIILLNNRTYTIEVQIHDGEYNKIMNWKYAELVEVFRDADETARGVRVTTNQQLVAALEQSASHVGVMLIECCVDKDDCTSNLLEWGSRVASANSRV